MRLRTGNTLIIILLLVEVSHAATVRRMTLDGLIEKSELVVHGRAAGSRCVWDAATQTIWTQTVFVVLDGPKGRLAGTVQVSEPGGIIGDVGHLFPGVPRFDPNQEVVLFLYRAPGNRIRVLGLMQGVYIVEQDRVTGERLARPAMQQREVVYEEGNRPPQRSTAAPSSPRLGEFLSLIREGARRR